MLLTAVRNIVSIKKTNTLCQQGEKDSFGSRNALVDVGKESIARIQFSNAEREDI
jgi:hypothetical protein